MQKWKRKEKEERKEKVKMYLLFCKFVIKYMKLIRGLINLMINLYIYCTEITRNV
jgi:hypothetical protein